MYQTHDKILDDVSPLGRRSDLRVLALCVQPSYSWRRASMVKAVVFDLFETLITESMARPAGVSSLGPELGCEREAFHAQWKARRRAVTVGHLSLRQALSDIATSLGSHVEDAILQRVCDERIRIKATSFDQVEDQVLRMIGDLRSRDLRLGIISNCFAEDVVAWPQCPLAPHFDCAVFSFAVGLAKPDPEIYFEAIRRLRVDVSETWFVGDGMHEELSGAEQAGLYAVRALWFLRRWPNFRERPCAAASVGCVEEILSLVEQSTRRPNGARRARRLCRSLTEGQIMTEIGPSRGTPIGERSSSHRSFAAAFHRAWEMGFIRTRPTSRCHRGAAPRHEGPPSATGTHSSHKCTRWPDRLCG